jgi:hypothetical protein
VAHRQRAGFIWARLGAVPRRCVSSGRTRPSTTDAAVRGGNQRTAGIQRPRRPAHGPRQKVPISASTRLPPTVKAEPGGDRKSSSGPIAVQVGPHWRPPVRAKARHDRVHSPASSKRLGCLKPAARQTAGLDPGRAGARCGFPVPARRRQFSLTAQRRPMRTDPPALRPVTTEPSLWWAVRQPSGPHPPPRSRVRGENRRPMRLSCGYEASTAAAPEYAGCGPTSQWRRS